jgi:hypothetical protein
VAGLDYGVGHLVHIPTNKRRYSGCYAHNGERVVSNKGHRFSVILPIPQGSLDTYLYTPYDMLRHAGITGYAPEYWREKVLEDSGSGGVTHAANAVIQVADRTANLQVFCR